MARRVAFFDLDRTLIDVNSGFLWVQEEWRAGNLTVPVAAKALYWMARYSLGAEELTHALDQAASLYRGVPEADLRARIDAWFEADVAHRLRPGAAEALARHRDRGDRLVLATSSSQYAAACAVRAFGLDAAVSTVVAVEDGVLTGRVAHPGFGRHKLGLCRQWVSDHDVPLSACAFYTDSYSDLPLLAEVGEPVVVHPDRRLDRAARARGWPVLDWGAAT